MCALDGVMWAGITWSPLSRVQALSKLSAVDDIKVGPYLYIVGVIALAGSVWSLQSFASMVRCAGH